MSNNETKKEIKNDSKAQSKSVSRRLTAKEKANLLTKGLSFNYDKLGLDFKNFHYHWANVNGVRGSNIELYEKVGYNICLDSDNQPIVRTGTTLGVKQYLMRIPQEEYKAIQYHKLDEVREIEKSIGRKNNPSIPEGEFYGEVTNTVSTGDK